MANPLIDKGLLSLQEAARKFGQARASFYLWERKGLLHLQRFPVGRPSVFVKEQELVKLLKGQIPRPTKLEVRDRTALNTEALRAIWDNDIDAAYDGIDWRTGRRV